MVTPADPTARSATGSLLLMRVMLLAVAGTIALLAVGLVAVLSFESSESSDPSVPVAAATLGVVMWGVAVTVLARRPLVRLDCSSDGTLALSYRKRFTLRLAAAESAALLGGVASLVSASIVPFVAGVLFAVVGFAWCAPTRSHLAADQDTLTTSGCARSLEDALRGAAPSLRPGDLDPPAT